MRDVKDIKRKREKNGLLRREEWENERERERGIKMLKRKKEMLTKGSKEKKKF